MKKLTFLTLCVLCCSSLLNAQKTFDSMDSEAAFAATGTSKDKASEQAEHETYYQEQEEAKSNGNGNGNATRRNRQTSSPRKHVGTRMDYEPSHLSGTTAN